MRLLILAFIIGLGCTNKVVEKKSPALSTEQVPDVLKLSNGNLVSSIIKSEEQWKSQLSENEYYVIRKKGTERAFTGALLENKEAGVYICKACGMPLFNSETKFKSGTGWPSYFDPIDTSYIRSETDYVIGYARTEVMCNRCGGHLGHVFEDGPKPTGLRYCINSVSLDFVNSDEYESYIINYK